MWCQLLRCFYFEIEQVRIYWKQIEKEVYGYWQARTDLNRSSNFPGFDVRMQKQHLCLSWAKCKCLLLEKKIKMKLFFFVLSFYYCSVTSILNIWRTPYFVVSRKIIDMKCIGIDYYMPLNFRKSALNRLRLKHSNHIWSKWPLLVFLINHLGLAGKNPCEEELIIVWILIAMVKRIFAITNDFT